MRLKAVALLGATAFLGAAQAVYAADMPVKAPVHNAPAAAVPYNWSGFYIGGNAGASWADADVTSNLIPGPAVPGSAALFGGVPANIGIVNGLGTGSLSGDGRFTGGGQIGFNWQFAPSWLVGIEADFNSFNEKLSLSRTGNTNVGGPTPTTVTNSLSTNWLATVRGRVGITFDRILLYVTGGAAFSDLNYSQIYSDTGAPPGAGSSSVKNVKTGWTVGGGGEWALADRWSVKAEYLYVQFDGQDTTTLLCAGGCGTFSQNLTGATSDLHVHIARIGLNYRFGGH
jgi:outer membrane immunogenic protein